MPPRSPAAISSPVQMMDLDGDGREEALAFFRQSDGEKPLKIYIFAADGDSYRQVAVIEGSGLAIYSVAYSDMNGDGKRRSSWDGGSAWSCQALTVYTLEKDGIRELARSDYVKYAVADLDGDGQRELTVLRADETGAGTADCYLWKNGTLTLGSSIRVSMTMAELSQQGPDNGGRAAFQHARRCLSPAWRTAPGPLRMCWCCVAES